MVGCAQRDKANTITDPVRSFEGTGWTVHSVAVSPDGRYVLAGSQLGDGGRKAVQLWDAETGKELRCFSGHSDWVNSVAFSPDGKQALSGGGGGKKHNSDFGVRLWNVETGHEIRRFNGHTAPVWCVSFFPNGRRAVSSSGDKSVRLWDVETGKELRRFEGHEAAVYAVAVSPSGKYVASGGGTATGDTRSVINPNAYRPNSSMPIHTSICLWDVESGQLIREFGGGSIVRSLAFSPDGHQVLSGHGGPRAGDVHLWDVETGKDLSEFDKDTPYVHWVAFSPDGQHALVADGRWASLWEVDTGKRLHNFDKSGMTHKTVAFFPDGLRFVSAGSPGGNPPKRSDGGPLESTIRLWEIPR